MTRFWWVRHGPTHAKGMVGWTDLPADLSDTAQIARLRDYLPPDAVVVSSDLQRAATTADAIAGTRTRLPDDPDLREIHFGNWEMLHHREIEARDPDLIRAFWDQPGDVRAPGGETWNEAAMRVSRAADALAQHHRYVIVVAHFGAILTQVQRALAIPAYDAFAHRIDNLSVTSIGYDAQWHVERINHIP
ncbi:MAG: histidine phosphatase family protein [Rhodobacter sp.]|nr:histidine phosphatase family protein [Rhodobacter sp.]